MIDYGDDGGWWWMMICLHTLIFFCKKKHLRVAQLRKKQWEYYKLILQGKHLNHRGYRWMMDGDR